MTSSLYFCGDGPLVGLCRDKMLSHGFDVAMDVRDADVAISQCSSVQSLEDCYFDEGGLVRNALPGTLFVDLSAATPSVAREIAAIAQVNDLRYVEAPLAVRDPGERDALTHADNVACYAAGEDDDVEAALPLIEALAGHVVRTGAAGTAQLAKARHTVRLAAHVIAEVESDALASRAALSAHSAQKRESDVSEGVRSTLAKAIEDGDFDGEYTVALLMSDVAAAMAAADDVDLILPQLESSLHILELIAVIGGADMSVSALSLLYRSEQECAEAGLDWTRAEGLFSEHVHEHDGWDEDDEGLPGAFGGYSFN